MQEIGYEFIPAGSIIDRVYENKLYLDVGNKLERGIIDHHQPNSPKHCTTYLLYLNPNLIKYDTRTIVLHQNPDLDCVASSYLAVAFLRDKKFPYFTKKLCGFVDSIDFGYSAENLVNLNTIFSFLKLECQNDTEIIKLGHTIIDDLSCYGFDSKNIPKKFKDIYKKIKNDYFLYLEDLKSSMVIEAKLPYKLKKGFKLSKGLVLEKPKSTLFKEWARNDTLRFKKGYDFLVVKWSKKRVVISVKPDDIIYLKGIGDRLNKAEKLKRESLGITVYEEIREGYDMPDPWYDGRNPNHNYTIIDSPHSGTFLSFEEILDIICL